MRSYRDDFPDLEGVAYLNTAYMGVLPRVAVAAIESGLRHETHPFVVRDEDFFDLPDAYRAEVAKLIGAAPEDVAVTDSTIHPISVFARGLDWRPGDEVLLPAGEFPSNRFPWLSLAARGVVVKEIEIPSAAEAAAAFDAAATPRTRVVAAGWVHYSTGRRLDLAEVGAVAKRRNALFVVDGSQGIGGLPFSLAETPCDLLACSGYKWLLGPYGSSFAWYSPELQERLAATSMNWFAVKGAREFNRLATCALELDPGARRFDVNETARFLSLPAAIASLRYIRAIGPATVAAHVARLHDRVVAGLPGDLRIVSSREPRFRSNLLCLVHENAGGADGFSVRAAEELARRKVRVSLREGALRVSPYLFNDDEDIDRLLDGLHAATRARSAVESVAAPRWFLERGEPVEPFEGGASGGGARVPESKTFTGETIELRPLDPARDLDDLYRAGHGDPEREELWAYLAYGPFASRDAMRAWLDTCVASRDPLFFTVAERATGRAIGMMSYLNIEPAMRRIEVGHIWYTPEWQRGRANREAVELLLAEAFERLGYRRVEWKCDSLNRRSRSAALRLGFLSEGLFRRHMISKGRNRDTAWYAMTDEEWRRRAEPAARAAAGPAAA